MKKEKKKKKFILPLIALIADGLLFAALSIAKDDFVIANGVRAYYSLQRTIIIIGAVILAATLILTGVRQIGTMKEKKAHQVNEQKKTQEEQKKKEEESFLSVKKTIDPVILKRNVEELMRSGAWPDSVIAILSECRSQMDKMDTYQEKLGNLLTKNGADALSDAQDMLDKVEQYLCKNIRKILNYLEVADADGEIDSLLPMLEKKTSDNQEKLKTVQEFLFTMADFLNSQGGKDNSLEMLTMFQTTILDSIKERGI